MRTLEGQHILLIGIGFYDYEEAIAEELRSRGAHVRVADEAPPETRGRLAPLRRRLGWLGAARERHHRAILQQVRSGPRLDHILVIKGISLDADFLSALRDAQPGARLTAYHWDSMARFPELLARQGLFDRVLTFDRKDALEQDRMLFRPSFYRPEIVTAPADTPLYDLSFVGWLHHDRLTQIRRITDLADRLGLTSFVYLYTGQWSAAKLRMAGKGRDVHTVAMRFSDYAEVTARSRIVVDLPHPDQTGLTMRAIDALGAGKKLITTATDIGNYDFFDPANIHVLDPASPDIPDAFLTEPPAPVPAQIVRRYSLDAWISDVFDLSGEGNNDGGPDR